MQRSRSSSATFVWVPPCLCPHHHPGLFTEISASVGLPPPWGPSAAGQSSCIPPLAAKYVAIYAERVLAAARRSGSINVTFLDFLPRGVSGQRACNFGGQRIWPP